MKKAFILTLMIMAFAITVSAEKREVSMEFHKKRQPNNTQVNRAPMRLPIEVVYDTELNAIEVININTTSEIEILIYDADGYIIGYSNCINAPISVSAIGDYFIRVNGDVWYAEGFVTVFN